MQDINRIKDNQNAYVYFLLVCFFSGMIIGICEQAILDIFKSDAFRSPLALLFFASIGLSVLPVIFGLAILALLFFTLHQFIAAGVIVFLDLVGVVARITNGFGVRF